MAHSLTEVREATPPLGSSSPTRSVLRNPAFRALFGSRTTSALGAAVSTVTVSWLVYHFTGSTFDVAYVGIASIVPGIVFGLYAGVLADRHNRRRLMLTSDIVRAVVMTALAATLYLIGFSLVLVLAAIVLVYTFTALFNPANQAMLPRLVGREQLEDANGALSATVQLSQTIGAGVGGLIIAAAGASTGLGINAATYALSAAFIFQIASEFGKIPEGPARVRRSVRKDLIEGFSYMKNHLPVLELTLGFLPCNFLIILIPTFLVVYSASSFGSSAATFGFLVASVSLGGVVGALSVGRVRARRFAGISYAVTFLGCGVAAALMVFGHSFPTAVAGAALFGWSVGFCNTVFLATMQAIVPNAVLGRVLSIDMVGSNVAIPAGLIVGGVLASAYGILFAFTLVAIGMLVLGSFELALPGVRSVRY